MKNWKKSLLLAAGLAVMIPTAAMATQKSSEQSDDMVTVEVKNVRGGALGIYYTDPEMQEEFWIPIGEKVKIPKNVELTIKTKEIGESTNLSWYSDKYEADVDSHLETLHINGKDGSEHIIKEEDIDSGYGDIQWTADQDYIFEAEFAGEMTVENRNFLEESQNSNKSLVRRQSIKENYFIEQPKILNIDSPQISEIKLNAKNGRNKVAFRNVPGVQFDFLDYAQSSIDEDKAFYEHTADWFEFTENGIQSKINLPLGAYNIPFVYKKSSESTDEIGCVAHINVGKQVDIGTSLGIFIEDDGTSSEVWEVGSRSVKNRKVTDPIILRAPLFFDGEKTTVGDIIRQIEVYDALDCKKYSNLSGYELTNQYRDANGKTVGADSTTKLKDATIKWGMIVELQEIYTKNGKEYTPVTIKKIPDSDIKIHYHNCVAEENGKYYYYDYDGNKVIGEWANAPGDRVFCSSDGSIVTNGIAGISMDDPDGLWYVGADGTVDDDYTNPAYEEGMFIYEIEEGEVISVTVKTIKTPSNATELNNSVEELNKNMNEMTEEQRRAYADKIEEGFAKLSKAEKDKINEKQIEQIDAVLEKAYGVESRTYLQFFSEDKDLEEDMALSRKNMKVKGLFAAAGMNSETLDENWELRITQMAVSASNAAASAETKDAVKKVLKFKAELFMNTKKVQLNGPVIIEVTLLESLKKAYPKDSYTFTIEHVKDDGKKEKITPVFAEDFSTMSVRTDSFSTFELQASKKKSSDNGSSSGGNSSGGSSSGGSSSGGSSSKKVKTYHAPAQKTEETIGKWQQDQNGWWFRFNNGSWPKNQWIELIWNGTSSWYYFNEKGYMETSWHKDGDEWYYLNPESDGTRGAMVTGWKQINNIWYYFSTVAGGPKGAMLSNTVTPDGYRIGADGAWVK